MADIMMIVDSAVVTPVNRLPLIDDTDFKTIESAVAYNAAGMDLRWNFVTAAGVQTSTAVTPTTAGSYDWTHMGDGIYSMELPASGGASANNDTEGFGWWSGVCTGVLPWAGPIIQFSPAHIVNGLVTGTDNLQVDTIQLSGTTQTARDIGASVLLSSGTGTGQLSITSGIAKVDVDTIKTNPVVNGGTATFPTNATLASTTNITAATGITLTATTGLGNQTANITGNLTGSVGSVTGAVGSVTGAVGSVTGAVGSVTGNVGGNVTGTVAGVTPATAAQVSAVLTTAMTEGYAADGATFTLSEGMYMLWSLLAERSRSTTTLTAKKLDGTTAAMTFTLDSATAPTSQTRAT